MFDTYYRAPSDPSESIEQVVIAFSGGISTSQRCATSGLKSPASRLNIFFSNLLRFTIEVFQGTKYVNLKDIQFFCLTSAASFGFIKMLKYY